MSATTQSFRFLNSLCVWCCWFTCATAAAQTDPLAEALLPLIKQHAGEVAVAVKHLSTGESFEYRATVPMPTASLIKFPVMIEAYRQLAAGKLADDAQLTLRAEDKVPGSGLLTTHFSPGLSLPVRDAIRLMIAYSDNTATNLLVERLGLPSTSTEMQRLGCPNTKLHSLVFRRDTSIAPERSQQFGLGSTTAAEMVKLLELLQRDQLVSPTASAEMRAHLLACQDPDCFSARLPKTVTVAHKTGAVDDVRTDAGLLLTPKGAIAMCVLMRRNKDQSWAPENAGNVLCARIARAVYDRFHPPESPGKLADPYALSTGDRGEWVEVLQRTLNARLKPSPKLGIDGEYGPTTQKAVQSFQAMHELEPTGVVTEATWRKLAPLITTAPVVPTPEVVNRQLLPKKPADAVVGPPVVTATAWAVGEVATGKVLDHADGDKRLEMASTTKIMTAFVVLRLAEKKAGLLDERVKFSQRADGTGGSTAAVRTGETVSVRELLYGLLLPSGNDAAVALAEHCGTLCAPPPESPQVKDPLFCFIAEMNRTARVLDLQQTHFMNPHGLPHDQHYTTPKDLLRLSILAWKQPLLQEIASTRQHGSRLQGPGETSRNIVWKNTNKLLEIEGYQGLKTGTTNAAGACLVTCVTKQGRTLVIVTLGSSSEETRYLDTRNLARWTWQRLGLKDPPPVVPAAKK